MFGRRSSLANECALLVAIPLNRREFEQDVASGADFVHSYARVVGRSMAETWLAFAPYADRCRRIIETTRALGVNIVERATLANFGDATRTFGVVTLVAHAAGPEIRSQHLIDPEKAVARMAEICEALGVERPVTTTLDRKMLACWLDAALGSAESADDEEYDDDTAQAIRVARYRSRWQRRRQVESLCGGGLVGGPAIEFADGLASMSSIAARVPRTIRTIDLTVCDSVMLAEYLRTGRSGGAILANPRPVTPDVRLAIYEAAIGLMSRHRRLSYIDAVFRLRRALARRQ